MDMIEGSMLLSERLAQMEDFGRAREGFGYSSSRRPGRIVRRRRRPLSSEEKALRRDLRTLDPKAKQFLIALEDMLRNQPGIHVRLPSHHAAPLNGRRFHNVLTDFLLDDGVLIPHFIDFPIRYDNHRHPHDSVPNTLGIGAEPVPEGYRAEVTDIQVWTLAANTASQVYDSADISRYDIRVNGNSLPGWANVSVNSNYYLAFNLFGGFGTAGQNVNTGGIQPAGTIHLRPGDTAELRVWNYGHTNGNQPFFINVLVSGWLYPIRHDVDSIAGTLAD